jgi:glyceraldehyde-3-phosphate dehydrogenase/erythrose-4-phosphate dehydrogenase
VLSKPPRIGANGFGRMGRLAFLACWKGLEIEFVHLMKTVGNRQRRSQ